MAQTFSVIQCTAMYTTSMKGFIIQFVPLLPVANKVGIN